MFKSTTLNGDTTKSSILELMWASKLAEAEKLSYRPKNVELTKEKYNEILGNVDKSVTLYNRLAVDPLLTPEQKLSVIKSYITNIPEEAKDIIARCRDGLRFKKGKEFTDLSTVIRKLVTVKTLDSHERMVCAVCLYNNGIVESCYAAFGDIANDVEIKVEYRVDSCRYLFGSDEMSHKEIAQECLDSIVECDKYSSEYRYGVIASFITKKGIHSMMNTAKIRVAYDEEFVYGLQSNFFNRVQNGIRERILSGQSLLGMECVEQPDRLEIMDKLLVIAKDESQTENTRADAADVLLRLGTKEYVKEAKDVIMDLGGHALATGSTLLQRIRTIYNDSQNAHNDSIAACVNTFLEKVLNDPIHTSGNIPTFVDVYNEVTSLIRSRLTLPSDKFSALRSLHRISIDTAVFTKYKVTNADVFVHVWICIKQHTPAEQLELEKRLLQELIESDDSCSTGHAERYVNVLSAYDVDLRITWADQIKANIIGRLEARIRKLPDGDEKQSIALGALVDADEADRNTYVKFITVTLDALYVELFKEFVGEGYIKKEEFERLFEDGRKAVCSNAKIEGK